MSYLSDLSFSSCMSKQEDLKKMFSFCTSKEAKYQKIMDFGKSLKEMPVDYRIEENIILGCQSIVYLQGALHKGKLNFTAHSEALISAGLVALLIYIYNDESPEAVIQCPPLFIGEIGLIASLSLNRANGFQSIYLRMKRDACKFVLINNQN